MITNSWLYLSPRFNKNAQQLSLFCIRQSKGVKKLSTDFFHFLLLATHCRFTWTWLGLGLKQKNACTFRFRSMASAVLVAVISCLAHSAGKIFTKSISFKIIKDDCKRSGNLRQIFDKLHHCLYNFYQRWSSQSDGKLSYFHALHFLRDISLRFMLSQNDIF